MKYHHKVPMYGNWDRKQKWLGWIDYPSLIALMIFAVIVISVVKLLPIAPIYMVYIAIFCIIPVVAIFLVHVGNDSILDVLNMIIRFILRQGIYVKLQDTKAFEPAIYIADTEKLQNLLKIEKKKLIRQNVISNCPKKIVKDKNK